MVAAVQMPELMSKSELPLERSIFSKLMTAYEFDHSLLEREKALWKKDLITCNLFDGQPHVQVG